MSKMTQPISAADRTAIAEAWSEPFMPGPWDSGTVHTHEPPFCWARSSDMDCTLRVIDHFRHGQTLRQVADLAHMSTPGLRERLNMHGVPLFLLTKRRAFTVAQAAVVRDLRERGFSGNAIAQLIHELGGEHVPLGRIYGVGVRDALNPPKVRMQLGMPVDLVQAVANLAADAGMKPQVVWVRCVREGLRLLSGDAADEQDPAGQDSCQLCEKKRIDFDNICQCDA
jgi:hypothetical protein